MKKLILLVFCICFNLIILYIIVLNSIQLYKLCSKKNFIDLIYSVFAFFIFIRVQVILFHKKK